MDELCTEAASADAPLHTARQALETGYCVRESSWPSQAGLAAKAKSKIRIDSIDYADAETRGGGV